MSFFTSFVDEIEKISKEKEKSDTAAKAVGIGAMGAGGATMVHGAVRNIRGSLAMDAAEKALLEAAAKHPDVDAKKLVKDLIKKKGLEGRILHTTLRPDPTGGLNVPIRNVTESYQGGFQGTDMKLVGTPSKAPRSIVEHEMGHAVRPKAARAGQLRHGLIDMFTPGATKKKTLGPELEAWREAKPGMERRDVRRAALGSYKGSLKTLSGARRIAIGAIPFIGGSLLLGHLDDRKKAREKAKRESKM